MSLNDWLLLLPSTVFLTVGVYHIAKLVGTQTWELRLVMSLVFSFWVVLLSVPSLVPSDFTGPNLATFIWYVSVTALCTYQIIKFWCRLSVRGITKQTLIDTPIALYAAPIVFIWVWLPH